MSTKKNQRATTDGQPARPGYENAGAPAPINPETGQHEAYWVLSESERAKGFVRPLRRSYRHAGERPEHALEDLTPEQEARFGGHGYVKYERYPESSPVTGRFWTQEQLDAGCGKITTASLAISETYARDPSFYGSTFCATCKTHRRVAEFVWVEDGATVGT